MTRTDISHEIARVVELTGNEADEVLDAIVAALTSSLRRGERVEVRRFGSFGIRQRNGRIAHDPNTGERCSVPPKKIVYFRPSQEVVALINRPCPGVGRDGD